MATSKQQCWRCGAPSINWPGAPVCQPCLDMAQVAPATGCPLVAENRPPKVVTIGGRDARELYLEHCTLATLEGHTNVGLASIAAPADARAAEIARGRPAGATLH
jgi:hypothetical protein